ncbi:hypothetical protein MG290_07825 [Flavobacterium sp. CBA20B-1]|uniref:hypothetical protein n=1 Tax=Flavobacterium sp. CBA20B-1 TaxID=2918454 RepID=UPI002349691F|nr:hypothetical protein [Flavobacterium sp. CBA20B-1]WCM40885.1 hypothetical protein MG290_07825 [Flavobacterium sp. CBA20B-1]
MYRFQLFHPAAKQPLPAIAKWFVALFAGMLLFCVTPAAIKTFKTIVFFINMLLCGYIAYYLATNYKRFYFTKGTFTGALTFSNEGILLKHQFIPYGEIQQIQFTHHDFLGKYNKTSVFNPSVSIGVSNQIKITLKNQEVHSHNFQMQHDYELFRAFPYLNKSKTSYLWKQNSI